MFKKPLVIMLSGKAGVGKSTTAHLLKSLIETTSNNKVEIFGFALPLKAIATKMGWDGKKDEKGRRLLQTLGTEVGRTYDKDMWCKLLFKGIEDQPIVDVIIIDDWRFPSELEFIRSRFPYIPITVRVVSTRELPNAFNHISENSLPEYEESVDSSIYDYVVDNSFDVDSLELQMQKIWKHIVDNVEFYYARGENK